MCFIPKLNVLSSKKDNEKTHQKPNFFLFIFRNSVDSVFMDAENENTKKKSKQNGIALIGHL